MKNKDVIIFGTREIALLAKYYLKFDSIYNPVAFCEDKSFINKEFVEDLPVVSFEEVEKNYNPKDYSFFCPLYDNELRKNKCFEIKKKGYFLISYISSKATVFTDCIGEHCFIMENNVLQPYVVLGNNIIMWSGNHIGHHTKIGNNVFLSSHVVVSGRCEIEDNCWFGVNSSVRDGVKIATNTYICMSSSVIQNTTANSKYRGNPAKPV